MCKYPAAEHHPHSFILLCARLRCLAGLARARLSPGHQGDSKLPLPMALWQGPSGHLFSFHTSFYLTLARCPG